MHPKVTSEPGRVFESVISCDLILCGANGSVLISDLTKTVYVSYLS